MGKFRSLIQALFIFTAITAFCSQFTVASAEQFVYDSHNRRDPFVPLVGPGSVTSSEQPELQLESIKLEGVVVDPKGGSFIMVDGEVYDEGHKIGPYVIEKIEEKRVVLKYNTERYELKMSDE